MRVAIRVQRGSVITSPRCLPCNSQHWLHARVTQMLVRNSGELLDRGRAEPLPSAAGRFGRATEACQTAFIQQDAPRPPLRLWCM